MIIKILISIVVFFVYSFSFAECDFKSSNYHDDLINPAKIESIFVEIIKNRKWMKNSIKIITDTSNYILKKYKKRLNANVKINYKFGKCNFNAKIRQSGDWKDHIKLNNKGQINSSIDVKLLEGNILNAVRFKLLLPETRNNENEIIGAYILKKLGFISPETFFVNVKINMNDKTLYLFQENSEKELLERNQRREGPIYEGDESLIWGYKNFKPFQLEPISLARLVNPNWSKKGSISTIISLKAFERIQNAYLSYQEKNNNDFTKIYLNPNSNTGSKLFSSYALVLLAMNGVHGLGPHNRKYYFNSFLQDFEPIYYDGNLKLNNSLNNNNLVKELDINTFLKNTGIENFILLINKLELLKNNLTFYNELKKRLKSIKIKKINNILIKIIDNLNTIKKKYKNKNTHSNNFNILSFNNNLNKFNLDVTLVQSLSYSENRFNFICVYTNSCKTLSLDLLSTSKLMSKNKINGKRLSIIPYHKKKKKKYKNKFLFLGEVLYSDNGLVTVDEEKRLIELKQLKASDWFFFRNTTLTNWTIKFIGTNNAQFTLDTQRFNQHGLTGCLNFFNTNFDNVSIDAKYGVCEDTINIVSSKGNLSSIHIYNSSADALDLDFSDLFIRDIKVINSRNDCLDMSYGSYILDEISAIGCRDKGISVGENSDLKVKIATIKDAYTGLSSKDFSRVLIYKSEIESVKNCFEAFQKKQEFGGGTIIYEDLKCKGNILFDENSKIVKKKL